MKSAKHKIGQRPDTGYNTRSELIGAERFSCPQCYAQRCRRVGANPQAPGAVPVAGQNWGYAYDPIGNRLTAERDGDYEVYQANELNQYVQRTVPGVAHVDGSAAPEAKVTMSVDGDSYEAATRQGAFFHLPAVRRKCVGTTWQAGKKVALDPAAAGLAPVTIVAALMNGGSNLEDIVSSETGTVSAIASPESFTYDADGNMTSDARFRYEWDCENRLIAAESVALASPLSTLNAVRLEFAYDYMSRRVSKRVLERHGQGWRARSESRFTYEPGSWNLIQELTDASSQQLSDSPTPQLAVSFFLWGLDLSGSLHGAGGIGGLLASYRSTTIDFHDEDGKLIICHRPPGHPENAQTLHIDESAWPAHEAHGDTLGSCDSSAPSNSVRFYTFDGNGNVSELLDSQFVIHNSPLAVVAHYEYDPYGNLLVAVGPAAFANPFRFSTKYWVDELGLGDWGRRWYSPNIGRWLSRDSLEEKGGLNLYLFVKNSPLSHYDAKGLVAQPNGCECSASSIMMRPCDTEGAKCGSDGECKTRTFEGNIGSIPYGWQQCLCCGPEQQGWFRLRFFWYCKGPIRFCEGINEQSIDRYVRLAGSECRCSCPSGQTCIDKRSYHNWNDPN